MTTFSVIHKASLYAGLSLCFSLFPRACRASTVIVLVTSDAIIVGADSKVTRDKVPGVVFDEPSLEIDKVFAINGRFLIGVTGESRAYFRNSDETESRYDMAAVANQLEFLVNNRSGIGYVIANGTRINIQALAEILPAAKREHVPQRIPYSTWIVCGYSLGLGVPIVTTVFFDVDWGSLAITTKFLAWHPELMKRLNRGGLYGIGYTDVAAEIEEARLFGVRNDAYKMCLIEALVACASYVKGQYLSNDQAISLIHAILKLQSIRDADAVGPPFLIFRLAKTGEVTRYDFEN